ncbi:MAG: hypothetical protein E6H04_11665 [Bacillati bacterium ANGP1]|uniref:Uncharacterized protein n=1 Tax=Candidatus Segetimicrobium genomatis TaxID=2569760 RepID=A0A537J5P5_9BACT|nr:MAG: hypothetical protein E6H04_11665 [Terrabacteria group bacterium ANGP1]
MKRHRSAIVSLAVLVVLALAAPSLPRAEAANAEFVLTTLETLQENYVDPVSAVTMLNAALVSLKQRTGVGPFDGPIPKGVSEARAAVLFTQRFDEVFSVVRARYSATDLAYAASAGMLESLHDSHTGFIPPEAYQEEKRKENGQAAFTAPWRACSRWTASWRSMAGPPPDSRPTRSAERSGVRRERRSSSRWTGPTR